MKKLIIILGAVFVLLLALGAAYVFFVMPMMAQNAPAAAEGEQTAAEKPAKKKKAKPSVYYSPGDFFVTNIKDSNRLLKLQVSLQFEENQAHADELAAKQTELRDYVISMLRSCTEEQLRADTAMEYLSAKMMEGLKTKFEIDYVEAIYLTDFVIQ